MKAGCKGYILVVEDVEELGDVLKKILHYGGYHVDVVNSGEEAIMFLEYSSTLPDLILFDWQLSKMNGLEMRKKMLGIPKLMTIPAIIMSATKIDESKLKDALLMGVVNKLELEIEDFLIRIESYFKSISLSKSA